MSWTWDQCLVECIHALRDAEGPWPVLVLVSGFFSCKVCMWIVCVAHTHILTLKKCISLTEGAGDPGEMGAQSPLAR